MTAPENIDNTVDTHLNMPSPGIREHAATRTSGMAMLTVGALIFVAGVALITVAGALDLGALFVPGIVLVLAGPVVLRGLAAVSRGEARVLQFLGRYTGTLRPTGLQWVDEERKAAMVSNLLVVLCGDRSTQPVVNTSSLYH